MLQSPRGLHLTSNILQQTTKYYSALQMTRKFCYVQHNTPMYKVYYSANSNMIIILHTTKYYAWVGSRTPYYTINFFSEPKASTSHRSSMHFAWNCLTAIQLFWNSFQLANKGSSSDETPTWPEIVWLCKFLSVVDVKFLKNTETKTRNTTHHNTFDIHLHWQDGFVQATTHVPCQLSNLSATTSCATMRPSA